MKTCRHCNTEKSLDNFYSHKGMKDGYLNVCKVCFLNRCKQHRQLNIERIRAYDRERGKDKKRIEKSAVICSSYRKQFPSRYKANNAVNNALRDGKIEKTFCFCCGASKVVAHHASYDHPLAVIWLCQVCHKAVHNLISKDPL